MTSKYRTVVADPPWDSPSYRRPGWSWRDGRPSGSDRPLDYSTLTTDQIAAIPVRDMTVADFSGPSRRRRREAGEPDHDGSHLYLWTTTEHMCDAHEVARAWGFVLFCRRGSLGSLTSHRSRWFEWPRGGHSSKPDAFIDLVEATSPGPYLELFARRQRLGWDTWGNEALNHLEVGA